jgi:xylulokinase
VRASASVPLSTEHRRPGWSEQDPMNWWIGLRHALATLRAEAPALYGAVQAIGLSGQMHGLVVTDRDGTPLNPAILWNDGRSVAECAELAARVPGLGALAGVIPMPGFLAPKLLWLQRHEPDVWARTRRVFLPKDWLRFRLTGVAVTDPCDASGALLLDVERRAYAPAILDALGLDEDKLAAVAEGSTLSARLDPEIAGLLHLPPRLPVATGGGDAACGGIGIGMVRPGDAFISLGTSAQYFVTRDRHMPAPDDLVHAFCHALPERWFQMAALLNGASALKWMADATGRGADMNAAMADAAAFGDRLTSLIVLPYLTGERTPLNDADARGVIFGVSPATTQAELLRGMQEGIVMSLMDCQQALFRTGAPPDAVSVVGGGARDASFMRLLASGLGRPVVRHHGVETGPAHGAARLARIALTGAPAADLCPRPPIADVLEPDERLGDALASRLRLFRSLYRALKPEFRAFAARDG